MNNQNRTTRRNRRNRAANSGARRNGRVRVAGGPSRMDLAIQKRTLLVNGRLALANTVSGIAFGLGSFAFKGDSTQSYAHTYLGKMCDMYEQYRVRRIRVYASPGANMTNDLRIKTQIMARVDPDSFFAQSTGAALGLLTGSSNTVTKRLNDTPDGTLLADFNPVVHPFMAGQSQTNGRMLLNNNCWMMLRDGNSTSRYHLDEWRGVQMGFTIPDGTDVDFTIKVQLRFRIDLEFRGRQVHGASYQSTELTLPKPADFVDSLANLKNGFLTGLYQPIDGWSNINVANLGHSVFGPDIIDCTYRRNSDSVYFRIISGDNSMYDAQIYIPT